MALDPEITAEKIIEFFREIGIVVCDDPAAIQARITACVPRYMSLGRSPSGQDQARAKTWQKVRTAVETKLPDVLELVYLERFLPAARPSVQGSYGRGEVKVTRQLVDVLKQLARTICLQADPKLERPGRNDLDGQWVRRFQQEDNLQEGTEINPPPPLPVLEGFSATNGVGAICLSWNKPPTNCDFVDIERSAPGQRTKDKTSYSVPASETVYRDKAIEAGVWYVYQARLREGTTQQGSWCPPCRARGLAEVTRARAVPQGAKLVVTWEQPSADVYVVIFRREGKRPEVKSGGVGGVPEPGKNTTRFFTKGFSETSWEDDTASEGVEYHYLLVAVDNAQGLHTEGVELTAKIPRPPPSLDHEVEARHEVSGTAHSIRVEWAPPPGVRGVSYVLLRRDGYTAPVDVHDPRALRLESTANVLLDTRQVEIGRCYTYAVWTCIREDGVGLFSRLGIPSNPVEVIAEVRNLQSHSADGAVELTWDEPPNIARVTIRRRIPGPPPEKNPDGPAAEIDGFPGRGGKALDRKVQNGIRYHYRVCCVYRPDGIREVCSKGVTADAVPDRLPEPVQDFCTEEVDAKVICRWTPPACGNVCIARSDKANPKAFGERCGVADIHGDPVVPAQGKAQAEDPQPDVNKPYYTVYTVAGSHAIAGHTRVCAVVPDVTNLQARPVPDIGAVLMWDWPEDAKSVMIARRDGDWPRSHDDPAAERFRCTKAEYDTAGLKYVDRISLPKAQIHYVVYTEAVVPAGTFYSPGLRDDCRHTLPWNAWANLRYRISWDGTNKKWIVVWKFKDLMPDFGGFAVVANQTSVPRFLTDGTEIGRWTPQDSAPATGHLQMPLSLDVPLEERWASFFCKLFVIEPQQREQTLVVYPNTCGRFPMVGPVKKPAPPAQTPQGPPDRFVCTGDCHCKRYAVEEMLFGSHTDSSVQPKRGEWRWHHKLRRKFFRRQILPVPVNHATGQRLTRKLCPKGHELPHTAGLQESLIVGLVGGPASGKTHYVATLVSRMMGILHPHFSAAINSANDYTTDRYANEFYARLFKQHVPFAPNPPDVTPPPLVYDLTFSGQGQEGGGGRGVDLVLYDTAGEHFTKDPQRMRATLQYLSAASGIVFLIDPLQIDAVRAEIPTELLPDKNPEAEPQNIVSRILKLMEDEKLIAEKTKISVPVAVAFSKCDILRDRGLIESNRFWNMPQAHHKGGFDLELHEDIGGMLGEYMMQWHPGFCGLLSTRFARHAFFGVSATGCSVDPSTGKYPRVSSWRVEDPILWLLAEMGVLRTKGQ